jgi:RNA polymerase sigma factor (sigma-70 family)
VWKQLEGLYRFGTSGHLGDAELLGRYVAGHRDESAEAAFAALVERHGPMVLGVCRRVLGDRHAAEDAFQATFLVLARKAGAISRREQLANWLHGVASRTALDARARAVRRRAREQEALATAIADTGPDDGPARGELRAILDEELARLPASYRGPVILCELDGLSRQVAARQLGIPEGTLSSRLARAKDLLRHRLTRRGLAPAVVALEAALAHEARALILPPSLAVSTIEAAARVAAGASLAEAVSASVVTLTQGALHTMLLAKAKVAAFVLATATVFTTGAIVLAQPGPQDRSPFQQDESGAKPGPQDRSPFQQDEPGGKGPGSAAGPQDDRLGAVERKLDRILEALGNRPGNTGAGMAGMMMNRQIGAARKTGPGIPSADQPRAGAAGPGYGDMHGRMQRQMEVMRGMMGEIHPDSPPIESRVADLERRLSDLERRFGQMERQLSRLDQSDPSDSVRSRRGRSEAAKKS